MGGIHGRAIWKSSKDVDDWMNRYVDGLDSYKMPIGYASKKAKGEIARMFFLYKGSEEGKFMVMEAFDRGFSLEKTSFLMEDDPVPIQEDKYLNVYVGAVDVAEDRNRVNDDGTNLYLAKRIRDELKGAGIRNRDEFREKGFIFSEE